MNKTYILHPTAIVQGKLNSRSLVNNEWRNLSHISQSQMQAGTSGTLISQGGTPYYDQILCLNYMFDESLLTNLRSKSITSVMFTTHIIAGKLFPHSSGYRHQIRYKFNNDSGENSIGSTDNWASASNAESVSIGNTAVGYIETSGSTAEDVTNRDILVTLSTSLPKYGYVIGPGTYIGQGAIGLITMSGSLNDTSLIVTTDETDSYIKIDNAWEQADVYIKHNDVWVQSGKSYIKNNGIWKTT